MTGNYQAEFFSQSPVGDNFSFPRRRAPIRRFPVIALDDNSRSVLTGPASQLAYLKEIKPFTHINPRKNSQAGSIPCTLSTLQTFPALGQDDNTRTVSKRVRKGLAALY